MTKILSLSDSEIIKLSEKEKIILLPNEKIEYKESDNPRMNIDSIQIPRKQAIGFFGSMFDLNNDGVIDESEQEAEKKFLNTICESEV